MLKEMLVTYALLTQAIVESLSLPSIHSTLSLCGEFSFLTDIAMWWDRVQNSFSLPTGGLLIGLRASVTVSIHVMAKGRTHEL